MSTALSATELRLDRQTIARIVGFLYVFTNLTAIYAYAAVRSKILALRDPGKSAGNMTASESLFRCGIATELITIVGVMVLLWGLYVILRPVNRDLALLAAFLRLAENFMLAFITLLELAALAAAKGAANLQLFGADSSHALIYTALRVYADSFNVGFLFLGLGSALFSYLWFRSRYIPRLLAGWGIFASSMMALVSLLIIVYPGAAGLGLTYMMPMLIYEVGLGFWLMFARLRSSAPTTAPA